MEGEAKELKMETPTTPTPAEGNEHNLGDPTPETAESGHQLQANEETETDAVVVEEANNDEEPVQHFLSNNVLKYTVSNEELEEQALLLDEAVHTTEPLETLEFSYCNYILISVAALVSVLTLLISITITVKCGQEEGECAFELFPAPLFGIVWLTAAPLFGICTCAAVGLACSQQDSGVCLPKRFRRYKMETVDLPVMAFPAIETFYLVSDMILFGIASRFVINGDDIFASLEQSKVFFIFFGIFWFIMGPIAQYRAGITSDSNIPNVCANGFQASKCGWASTAALILMHDLLFLTYKAAAVENTLGLAYLGLSGIFAVVRITFFFKEVFFGYPVESTGYSQVLLMEKVTNDHVGNLQYKNIGFNRVTFQVTTEGKADEEKGVHFTMKRLMHNKVFDESPPSSMKINVAEVGDDLCWRSALKMCGFSIVFIIGFAGLLTTLLADPDAISISGELIEEAALNLTKKGVDDAISQYLTIYISLSFVLAVVAGITYYFKLCAPRSDTYVVNSVSKCSRSFKLLSLANFLTNVVSALITFSEFSSGVQTFITFSLVSGAILNIVLIMLPHFPNLSVKNETLITALLEFLLFVCEDSAFYFINFFYLLTFSLNAEDIFSAEEGAATVKFEFFLVAMSLYVSAITSFFRILDICQVLCCKTRYYEGSMKPIEHYLQWEKSDIYRPLDDPEEANNLVSVPLHSSEAEVIEITPLVYRSI